MLVEVQVLFAAPGFVSKCILEPKPSMKRDIGIFSGTFDPVHSGHVSFCSTVISKFALDELIVIVNRDPKSKVPSASLTHRYSMTKLAFKNLRNVSVQISTRADASFDDVRNVADGTLYLLAGSDVLKGIENWSNIIEWVSRLRVIMGVRNDTNVDAMVKRLNDLGFVESHAVATPYTSMTSTSIRSAKAMQDVSIEDYIRKHRLYM